MNVRRLSLRLAPAVLVICVATAVQAAPWSKITTRKKPEPAAAAPSKYAVTENNGPWMILAASFSGEGAEKQAQELVEELRTKFKLPAYSFQKEFDYSKSVQGRGVDRYGGPQSMRDRRSDDIVEIAVLVGDYQNVDDPQAQKALEAGQSHQARGAGRREARLERPGARRPAQDAGRFAQRGRRQEQGPDAQRLHHHQSAVAARLLHAQGGGQIRSGNE